MAFKGVLDFKILKIDPIIYKMDHQIVIYLDIKQTTSVELLIKYIPESLVPNDDNQLKKSMQKYIGSNMYVCT